MKNIIKHLAIIALVAVIGTVLAGCASMIVVGIDNESVTGPKQVRQYGSIDPKDITVYAFYKDGSRKPLAIIKEYITFDNSKVGRQTVNIRVTGGTASFETEVMALTEITATAQPRAVKLGLAVDSKWPGLEIQGAWDQMGTAKIDNAECQVTGIDISRAGRQTLTVAYKGKQTTFNTEVVALESIRITSNPAKLTYNYGENLDTTGLKVAAVWPILGEQELSGIHSGSGGGISGYNSQTIGRQTVTITYLGKTATFTVEVVQTLNGTWVTTGVGWTFNNGNWERFFPALNNGNPIEQGTYTTNGGKITMTTTRMHGSALGSKLEAKWYTKSEYEAADRALNPDSSEEVRKQMSDAFFSTSTYDYSFNGNRLTLTLEGGQPGTYTKR